MEILLFIWIRILRYSPHNNTYYIHCISAIENKTLSSDTILGACNNIEIENFTINNNCSVLIDGIEEIEINGILEVQSGSSIEIKF